MLLALHIDTLLRKQTSDYDNDKENVRNELLVYHGYKAGTDLLLIG